MDDYKLDVIHVLDSTHPKTFDYALVLATEAKSMDEALYIPMPYVSRLLETIDETELSIIENTERWYKDGLQGKTFVMDTTQGTIQQNYVNLFGWLDKLIIRGDGSVFNMLRDMVLNMYYIKDIEDLVGYVASNFQKVAYFLEFNKIPYTKTYHSVERVCKSEGLTMHQCAHVCASMIQAGVYPHPNCNDFFFIESEHLGKLHEIIAKTSQEGKAS